MNRMNIVKCTIPLNVQFEVTYKCNNCCNFCYNPNNFKDKTELTTQEAIHIILDLASCGVLSLNFNGGEPLIRDDFFDIASVAKKNGMDIHMNTNATLIDDYIASKVAAYFDSICTSILAGDSELHDRMCGRRGAFKDTLYGIRKLQDNSVYVAVNIMLSQMNFSNLEETLNLMRDYNIRSVLVTRYVPDGLHNDILHISNNDFLDAIRILYEYNDKYNCFDRIALPQPFKLCNTSSNIRDNIAEGNIACNIGLCTASISPNGDVVPCNLVKSPVMGNLKKESFIAIWKRFNGADFCLHEHLTEQCATCPDIANCGGGCKGYNDAIRKE